MKFKSQIVTQASGSIGGTTFAHNRAGMYMRARSIPVNPSSTTQVERRSAMASAVVHWGLMTEVQRSAWRTYAENVPVTDGFGDPQFLTGQQMWIRSATIWSMLSVAMSTKYAAPIVFNMGDTGLITLTSITAATNVAVVGIAGSPLWAASAGNFLICQFGIPQNASLRFFKGPYRFGGADEGNAVPITTGTFDSDDCDPPIDIGVGQRIFLRLRTIYSDGRLSAPIFLDGLAV